MTSAMVSGDCGRCRCKHCKELYQTDNRNRRHQQYCSKAECRRVSKKASQERWLHSAKGRGYFSGPENVDRVRLWRQAHPGYSKPKRVQEALQDVSTAQVIDLKGDSKAESAASNLSLGSLQDICTSQAALLIGIIACLSGSTLQDDIAETSRRFICSGQDILGCKH